MLCLENGLSVIENPKPSRGSYGTWLGDTKPPTVRARLEQFIDEVITTGPKDFDSFLASMKVAGVQAKRGNHLAFQIPGGKRFVRCDSLDADYSEAAICKRIAGARVAPKKPIVTPPTAPPKPNLLIDIQAKLQQANSPGFERWAKIYNLKEMAKTLLYLQENGLEDYDALVKACDDSGAKFDALTDRTKAGDKRMKEIAELQKHIGTYSKTREIYTQYRKLPSKKAVRFYEEHISEILSCQAVKRFYDSVGLKKLPSIQSLKQEYAALLAENKKRYPELKTARAKMIELMTAKNNVGRILGMSERDRQRSHHREEGR